MPKEGSVAPNFAAKDANGEPVRLKDLRARKSYSIFTLRMIRLVAPKRLVRFAMRLLILRNGTSKFSAFP